MNRLLLLKIYLASWIALTLAVIIYSSVPAVFFIWSVMTVLMVCEIFGDMFLTRAIFSIRDYLRRLCPTSYFIRGLSGENLQLLSAGGVKFLPELQNGAEGIRVSRRYRGKILSLLKARIVSTFPLEGRTHEMVLAERRKGRSKFTARLTGQKLWQLIRLDERLLNAGCSLWCAPLSYRNWAVTSSFTATIWQPTNYQTTGAFIFSSLPEPMAIHVSETEKAACLACLSKARNWFSTIKASACRCLITATASFSQPRQ